MARASVSKPARSSWSSALATSREMMNSGVERPTVPSSEPLKSELESFLEAVETGSTPEVSLSDGLRALELARTIEQQSLDEPVATIPATDD